MSWGGRRSLHLVAMLLLAAALAACAARTVPPAPVLAGGSSHGAAARAAAGPHPDAVTVQAGETLYGIARRYDVPVRSLIEANGLTPPYKLTSGRKLVLPQVAQHSVQPGDTLYSISRLHGVDTSTLARTNGLAPPYVVRVGQALILPAPVTAAPGRAPVIQATAPAAAYARPAEPAAPAAASPAAETPAATAETLPPPPPPRPEEPAPPRAIAEARSLPPSPPPAAAAAPAAAPSEQTAALPPPEAAAPRNGARSFLWPVQGRLVAGYGTGEGGVHNDGLNIAAPEGTPVLAADGGVVAYAGNELRGYGNLVLIKHADGWMTAYAHNEKLLVKRGERVKRGQEIAKVGATGAVGEPQLHFEIRHGTRALDPGDYLPPQAATAAKG